MEFKKIAKNSFDFVVRRFIELLGFCIAILGLMLFIALLSYSPEDPNFIFNNEAQINNLLGFKGSVVSDVLFQSIGLISILLSVTIFIAPLPGPIPSTCPTGEAALSCNPALPKCGVPPDW